MSTSTKRPWMPIFLADYLARTTHLSASESGAYIHLLMNYWSNSGLPADEDQIARISRLTPKEWSRSRKTIKALFAPGWVDKQMDAEIRKMVQISEKRREAINLRWSRRDTNEYSNEDTNHHTNTHTNDIPLHTTHSTQGPVQADNLSVGDIIRGQRGQNGAPFRRKNGANFGLETEDVFGAGVAR